MLVHKAEVGLICILTTITFMDASFYSVVRRMSQKFRSMPPWQIRWIPTRVSFGKMAFLWLIAASNIQISKTAYAEEAPSDRSAKKADIHTKLNLEDVSDDLHRSIKELGSPVYRERQAAFLRIWRFAEGGRRKAGLALIEAATHSLDIDVAASARWLQVLMSLSASPSEASELIEELLLIRSGDAQTVLRLARNHRWDHLLAMLDVLSTEDRARLLSESESINGPRATVLGLAWSDHEEHRIPALVDHLWGLPEAIDARLLWNSLGLQDWATQTPDTAFSPSERVLWEITQDEINKRIPHAVEWARTHGREDLATSILLENGFWNQAIPKFATQVPPVGSITTGQTAVQAARVALILQWSGDHKQSQRWIETIGLPGPNKVDVDGAMLALSLCGRTDAVLSIAEKRDPDRAYSYLLRQGRIEEAFHSIGIERFDEEAIQHWINQIIKKNPLDKQADAEITERMASVGCLLSRLGAKDLGRIVDQAAVQWATTANGDHVSGTLNQRASTAEISRDRWRILAKTWTTQHRRSLALSQLKQLLREGIDAELRIAFFDSLYGPRESSDLHLLATPIILWLYEQRGKDDWPQAVDDLEQLLAGSEPTAWPKNWKRDGFPVLGRSLLEQNAMESGDSELPILLAKLALIHGRTDLFKEWLCSNAEPKFREWMNSFFNTSTNLWGTPIDPTPIPHASFERLEILAEMLIDQRDYHRAMVVFEQLLQLNPERLDYSLRLSNCLRLMGETELSNQIRIQKLSIPLSVEEVPGIIVELEKEQLYSDAILLLKHALTRKQNRRTDDWVLSLQLSLLQHARLTPEHIASNSEVSLDIEEQRTLLAAAIDDDRRQMLARLQSVPNRVFPLEYAWEAVESYHRFLARVAIIDGDFDAADQAIRACHAISPDGIEAPIELIPIAEKAFGADKIEAWIELYASPLEKHLQRWPHDTLIGNNLAWFLANVDRRLDRALELSRHVAELLPRDAVYLDTLAEVEFRLGNIDKAIELESFCQKLTPLEPHHQKQIHRFLKAKP